MRRRPARKHVVLPHGKRATEGVFWGHLPSPSWLAYYFWQMLVQLTLAHCARTLDSHLAGAWNDSCFNTPV